MVEVETQAKNSLVIQYVFSSLMIIIMTASLWLSVVIVNLEIEIYGPYSFATMLGFLAFFFIMASILARSLDNLFDAIYKLNEGDYK